MENNDPHILHEPSINLVPANMAKRLINYLVDVIVFSIVFSMLLPVFAPIYPLAAKFLAAKADTAKVMAQIELADQLMISFFYGLYMSILEALLKGKSIGKYFTGTRAVTETGHYIPPQTAFVRGLVRIVPLEQFSALLALFMPVRPWHDGWSKTIVIEESKSTLSKIQ